MLSLNKMFAFILSYYVPFFFLSYCTGQDLHTILKRKKKRCEQKPLPFSQMQEGNIQILAIKYNIRCKIFIGSLYQVEEIPSHF